MICRLTISSALFSSLSLVDVARNSDSMRIHTPTVFASPRFPLGVFQFSAVASGGGIQIRGFKICGYITLVDVDACMLNRGGNEQPV